MTHDAERAPPPNGRTAFGLTVPPWVIELAKNGPWTLLAFVLVWKMFFQVDQGAVMAKAIQDNGAAIGRISVRMETAGEAMHVWSVAVDDHLDAIMLVQTEMCVVQAESLKIPGGTQRCFEAARGIATRLAK